MATSQSPPSNVAWRGSVGSVSTLVSVQLEPPSWLVKKYDSPFCTAGTPEGEQRKRSSGFLGLDAMLVSPPPLSLTFTTALTSAGSEGAGATAAGAVPGVAQPATPTRRAATRSGRSMGDDLSMGL